MIGQDLVSKSPRQVEEGQGGHQHERRSRQRRAHRWLSRSCHRRSPRQRHRSLGRGRPGPGQDCRAHSRPCQQTVRHAQPELRRLVGRRRRRQRWPSSSPNSADDQRPLDGLRIIAEAARAQWETESGRRPRLRVALHPSQVVAVVYDNIIIIGNKRVQLVFSAIATDKVRLYFDRFIFPTFFGRGRARQLQL
jgi:hypothetical protein